MYGVFHGPLRQIGVAVCPCVRCVFFSGVQPQVVPYFLNISRLALLSDVFMHDASLLRIVSALRPTLMLEYCGSVPLLDPFVRRPDSCNQINIPINIPAIS